MAEETEVTTVYEVSAMILFLKIFFTWSDSNSRYRVMVVKVVTVGTVVTVVIVLHEV